MTSSAKRKWDAISPDLQNLYLGNVWCGHCGSGTTMINFNTKTQKRNLVLHGQCKTCGKDVARYLEGEQV